MLKVGHAGHFIGVVVLIARSNNGVNVHSGNDGGKLVGNVEASVMAAGVTMDRLAPPTRKVDGRYMNTSHASRNVRVYMGSFWN